ncbi:sensor histidine kinase [Pseudovibrio sp. Tun.PSC04-5.I4]|uniref:sensor histidine kinase n=1 Tax=Pseudovibrio sp. Tun.PSC04-5.I4 TaxID=1798213 RepID=UPI001FCC4E26|nr:sensor histidine kinase [Pseudovibrio sp. Tun.PSC04-5.I4]
MANTRAMGAVLGGLLGGPITGLLVGITGGLHRYSFGGFTDLACTISTTSEGLLTGAAALYLRQQNKGALLFRPLFVFWLTLAAEAMQMLIILAVARPFDHAFELVQQIAIPMLLVNSLGAALFMSIVRDQKTMFDKLSSAFSSQALKIAERCVGVLAKGLNETSSAKVARIVSEETKVGAVAITDRYKLLAFTGSGSDHHIPGTPISSRLTLDAITHNTVMYANGVEVPYGCSISQCCKLGSCLVIPLRSDTEVIGTIKMYEQKNKMFLNINRTLGEGIAKLLSNQILYGELEEKQNLLTCAELKLLQAQVNPHFLFNTLNTIAIITKRDPVKARFLLLQFSKFLRINLKRTSGLVSLSDELDHIDAYLAIEKARFADKLSVEIDLPTKLHNIQVPAFTLQPIIENAIKHGISQSVNQGHIHISGHIQDDAIELRVEDNAGLYVPPKDKEGLGMSLVDKRLKKQWGEDYGLSIEWEDDLFTRVSIRVPQHDLEAAQ